MTRSQGTSALPAPCMGAHGSPHASCGACVKPGVLAALASSIAHAMREPLTAMGLEAGAAQRASSRETAAAPGDSLMEGLRRIQQQAARAEAQIRCLHALMRVEADAFGGLREHGTEVFALAPALDEAATLAQAALYDAALELQLHIDTTLACVRGNRAHMQHAMLSLLAEVLEEAATRRPVVACNRLHLYVRTDPHGRAMLSAESEYRDADWCKTAPIVVECCRSGG